jgi:hypothetical protein
VKNTTTQKGVKEPGRIAPVRAGTARLCRDLHGLLVNSRKAWIVVTDAIYVYDSWYKFFGCNEVG